MTKIFDIINRELQKVDYKLNDTFKDFELYSFIIFIILIGYSSFHLYDNSFWSYILILFLILLFINILSTKDFTTFNLLKNLVGFVLKPMVVLFIICENIGTELNNIIGNKSTKVKIMIGLLIFSIPFLIYLIFYGQSSKCKYDLYDIRKQNESKFDRSDICSNLDLKNCYSLKELQPCLKELANDLDCNYCMDYDYDKCSSYDENSCNDNKNCKFDNNKCTNKNVYCENILDKDKCKSDDICNYNDLTGLCSKNDTCEEHYDDKDKCNNKDECTYNYATKECKSKNLTSDIFCTDNFDKTNYKIENGNVQCKDNKYCSQKLATKYCANTYFKYENQWLIIIFINILILIFVIFFYRKHCISSKSFALIILLINIFTLMLIVFLKNSGSKDIIESED